MTTPSPISKCGCLTKQGHLWRNWKERWFVLEEHLLKYYKGQGADGTPPKELGELKGVITVTGCTVTSATPAEADGRKHCFKITPRQDLSKKIYLINASDDATRDSWIAAVSNNARSTGVRAAALVRAVARKALLASAATAPTLVPSRTPLARATTRT